MSDKPPIGFFVWKEDSLSANAESHEGDQEEDDEVHHVLDHSTDHHHVGAEVLVHAKRSQAADVPVLKRFFFTFIQRFN